MIGMQSRARRFADPSSIDGVSQTGEYDEAVRVARLLDAQDKAAALFAEIAALIRPGLGEQQLSAQIHELAAARFGVRRHWHKRVVRAGVNTLAPFAENPPERIVGVDDIVYVDLGPIFEDWEADFGRTFVLGADPAKHALAAALPRVWAAGRAYFDTHPEVTGAQLYDRMVALAAAEGYGWGSAIAGHLVGEFPHKQISGNERDCYITAGSDAPMRRVDRTGRVCHWILEVHLIDPERRFGGFCEELLDLGAGMPR